MHAWRTSCYRHGNRLFLPDPDPRIIWLWLIQLKCLRIASLNPQAMGPALLTERWAHFPFFNTKKLLSPARFLVMIIFIVQN